jgi:hypothetical protein
MLPVSVHRKLAVKDRALCFDARSGAELRPAVAHATALSASESLFMIHV